MKLARLESTTQQHPNREAVERLQQHAEARTRRVEAAEGVCPDRERSLQQEVAEIEPQALADFAGRNLIMAQARALAAELAQAAGPLDRLIRPTALAEAPPAIDDKV